MSAILWTVYSVITAGCLATIIYRAITARPRPLVGKLTFYVLGALLWPVALLTALVRIAKHKPTSTPQPKL